MTPTPRSGPRAATPDHCNRARMGMPHGGPTRAASAGLWTSGARLGPGTAVAQWMPATMRPLAVAVLCLALTWGTPAGAARCGDDVDGRSTPCDCGDVLVGSRTLGDADPITTRVCPGSGLLVNVPAGGSATLALGGHVLAGSRRGFGIQVLAGGDAGLTIVGPGGVRGFDVGILAPGGGVARVSDVTAAENATDGFRLVGEGYVVTRCEALRNGRDGFALDGRRFVADGNRALANVRHGFQLAGRDAGINGVAGNEAAGNGRDGFHVRGRGHDLEGAVATANGRHGIRAHVPQGRVAGGVASANGRRGIRAAGADLVVTGNEARDNRSGIELRGVGVRDAGGNRSECGAGKPCR